MSEQLTEAKAYIEAYEQWLKDHPGQQPEKAMTERYLKEKEVVDKAQGAARFWSDMFTQSDTPTVADLDDLIVKRAQPAVQATPIDRRLAWRQELKDWAERTRTEREARHDKIALEWLAEMEKQGRAVCVSVYPVEEPPASSETGGNRESSAADIEAWRRWYGCR